MLRKIGKAISNPEHIIPYLAAKVNAITHLASEGRIGEAIAYAPTIIGIDIYTPYLYSKTSNGLLKREIQGNKMYLDPLDKGISQDLIIWGVREELPIQAFIHELEILVEEVEGNVTVFDIGTNIGYFLLIESNVLGEAGNIYTVEPHPRNCWLASKNIELNNLEIDVPQGAIGATSETVELYVSNRSNKHRINSEPIDGEYQDIIEVPQWTVDNFFEINNVDHSQVNVLRMDVEGHEAQVFAGMDAVLNSASPLLIFLELHCKRFSDQQMAQIIDRFIDHDFQIVGAFYDPPLLPGKELDISNFNDLQDLPHDVQLLVKRS